MNVATTTVKTTESYSWRKKIIIFIVILTIFFYQCEININLYQHQCGHYLYKFTREQRAHKLLAGRYWRRYKYSALSLFPSFSVSLFLSVSRGLFASPTRNASGTDKLQPRKIRREISRIVSARLQIVIPLPVPVNSVYPRA